MAISMIAITIVSALFSHKVPAYGSPYEQVTNQISNSAASYAIMALLCIFIACFALSW
jgi:hypothetical protein